MQIRVSKLSVYSVNYKYEISGNEYFLTENKFLSSTLMFQ